MTTRKDDPRAKNFTLVFAGDIRTFKLNPLTTETPFGVAHTAGVGDAFEECDVLRAALEKLDPDYEDTLARVREALETI